MSITIPDKYVEIVNLVIKYDGCIFGGCVRDFIRGDDPSDIDVSISDAHVQDFYESLPRLGYLMLNKFGTKFSKGEGDSQIIVDVCELSEDSEFKVELCIAPDFDVNMLAWDGIMLFDYSSPNYGISDIIGNIKMKRAAKISPSDIRLRKMLDKGWIII